MQDFPRIYWINLERSVARRQRMQACLAQRKLAAQRVEAVDAADSVAMARAIRCQSETPAVAACLASHLRAIAAAYRAEEPLAVFMEDDASFELYDKCPTDLASQLALLPADFSALWLGYGDTPRRLDAMFRHSEVVLPVPAGMTLWSTVAYLLHRRAMGYLLERYAAGEGFDLRDFPLQHEADTVLLHTLTHAPNMAQPYALRVPLFIFDGESSEIHPTHLRRQRRARDFVMHVHDDLLHDRYVSPFSWQGRLARWNRALLGRSTHGRSAG